MDIRRTMKRTATVLLAAVALAHGVMAVRTAVVDARQNASPARVAFERTYGIDIRGANPDSGGDDTYAQLGVVTARELAEHSLDVVAVRFQPSAYARQTLPDQLETLIATGYDGQWNPLTRVVTLMDHARIWSTGHHEYKHAITYEILKQHPAFKEAWKRLATDATGQSMYHQAKGVLRTVRGISKLVPQELAPIDALMRSGFVSEYATTNFYEDAAELGEWAARQAYSSAMPDEIAQHVLEHPQSVLGEKVRLAQEYGLIPAHFVEYLILKTSHAESFACNRWGNNKTTEQCIAAAQQFLSTSATFLNNHPESSLASQVYMMRSYVLDAHLWREQPWATQADVLRERLSAMTAPLVTDDYVTVLEYLESQVKYAYGEQRVSGALLRAQSEYWNRFRSGDPVLARRGVNDVLEREGVFAWMRRAISGEVVPQHPNVSSIPYAY